MTATTSSRPRPARTRSSRDRRKPAFDLWRLVITGVLLLVSLAFISPLLIVISASFSSESAISEHGYSIVPQHFTTFAYRYVLSDPAALLRAYGISIIVTVVGTLVSLILMSMLAFAISHRDSRLGRPLSFYVLFTMIFNGGLVPTYILITQYLHLQDTILVLILPYLVTPWFVLLLRTFFTQLPADILDAARVDGAGEWRIFTRIVLPLSKPALATVGLFVALLYWNDWWLGLLYITNDNLVPVQLYLYRILTNIDFLTAHNQFAGATQDVPIQTLRMAIALLAIGPIVVVFFFVQRFLVRGITVGGIKG